MVESSSYTEGRFISEIIAITLLIDNCSMEIITNTILVISGPIMDISDTIWYLNLTIHSRELKGKGNVASLGLQGHNKLNQSWISSMG